MGFGGQVCLSGNGLCDIVSLPDSFPQQHHLYVLNVLTFTET